jgi:hypothetical protein
MLAHHFIMLFFSQMSLKLDKQPIVSLEEAAQEIQIEAPNLTHVKTRVNERFSFHMSSNNSIFEKSDPKALRHLQCPLLNKLDRKAQFAWNRREQIFPKMGRTKRPEGLLAFNIPFRRPTACQKAKPNGFDL